MEQVSVVGTEDFADPALPSPNMLPSPSQIAFSLQQDRDPRSDARDIELTRPPVLINLGEWFPSWNIESSLQNDILGLDVSPFNRLWPAEPRLTPSLDLGLLHVEHVRRIWFTPVPETPSEDLYPEKEMDPVSVPASEPSSPREGDPEIDD
jgi:hypothetical protein